MRNSTLRLAAVIAALLLPGSAGAIPLGTLIGGGTLSSDDGAVYFSDFQVSTSGGHLEAIDPLAGLDLMLIDVEVVTWDDLRTLHFAGTIELAPYELGQIQIVYSVAAGDGFEIIGATLEVEAETFGSFSSVTVNEDVFGDASASLAAFTRSDGPEAPTSAVLFDGAAGGLVVASNVWIDGGTADGTTFTHLSQGYRVQPTAGPVPEPSAALVFAAGLAVIGARVRARRIR